MTERKPRVEVPRLGAQTADTHAHLDMLDDPAGALERAAVAGVMYIATVADVTEAPLGTFDALGTWVTEAQERMDLHHRRRASAQREGLHARGRRHPA
jgi:hypothetical protein